MKDQLSKDKDRKSAGMLATVPYLTWAAALPLNCCSGHTVVSGTEPWLLAGCAYQTLPPSLLLPTPGLGQFLQKIHGDFFAVAFPVLPVLQKGICIADWERHFETKDGAEFLQRHAMVFGILGGMYMWLLCGHHMYMLCNYKPEEIEKTASGRKETHRKKSMRSLQVSFPLVATKLFHGLDSTAQHAIHGYIDTCTARGKMPMWRERGALIERFLELAAVDRRARTNCLDLWIFFFF